MMKSQFVFLSLAAGFLLSTVVLHTRALAAERPNIVVILTDDQGYADISFNPCHPPEVNTPHMDSLACEGIFFSQAYISGNVCSPTRAGLMLGRYQQRVGVYTAGDGGRGFDPKVPLFPSFLPDEYYSGVFGKWHLGLDDDRVESAGGQTLVPSKWHALERGFDTCYKFMGRGAHDYYVFDKIYVDHERLDLGKTSEYMTTKLTKEAANFIKQRKDQPFFLYLAYNAVHSPQQAPQEDIDRYKARYPHLTEGRAILMAMLYHLDLGVGRVVQTLKDEGVWDNTLLFFFTDNGGAKGMEANNAPLKGFKASNYEGGIRTPFVVSWPAQFEGGRTIDTPIISLDVLPTALDAAGVLQPLEDTFDGKSLLPLLRGETDTRHENLFWSEGGETDEWAVRAGDLKLITTKDQQELFDLAHDPVETQNLALSRPYDVQRLTQLYCEWVQPMANSIKGYSSDSEMCRDMQQEEVCQPSRLIREPFDYDSRAGTVGDNGFVMGGSSLDGANGGVGWNSPWKQEAGKLCVVSPEGGDLVFSDENYHNDRTGEIIFSDKNSRTLMRSFDPIDSTVWISFLVGNLNGNSKQIVEFGINGDDDAGYDDFFRIGAGSSQGRTRFIVNGRTQKELFSASDNTYLSVIKLETNVDENKDRVSWWLFEEGKEALATQNATGLGIPDYTFSDVDIWGDIIDGIVIYMDADDNRYSGNSYFDNLRISHGLADDGNMVQEILTGILTDETVPERR